MVTIHKHELNNYITSYMYEYTLTNILDLSITCNLLIDVVKLFSQSIFIDNERTYVHFAFNKPEVTTVSSQFAMIRFYGLTIKQGLQVEYSYATLCQQTNLTG